MTPEHQLGKTVEKGGNATDFVKKQDEALLESIGSAGD